MKKYSEFSVGQQEFIDQMTRKLMIDWCHVVMGEEAIGFSSPCFVNSNRNLSVYLDFAVSKKWLAIKEERPDHINSYRILAAGWQTAARFLKR